MKNNRVDNRAIPPTDDRDDRPRLPPFRTFMVRRDNHHDLMLTAHGYDTEEGVARFFVFVVEVRDETQGPIIVQYVCRSFKVWTEVEEIYQVSLETH